MRWAALRMGGGRETQVEVVVPSVELSLAGASEGDGAHGPRKNGWSPQPPGPPSFSQVSSRL